MPVHKSRALGFASCALASSLWGCGFFFGKIALAEINVGAMVLYRFLFATLALAPLLLRRRPRFSRADWGTLLLASFLGIEQRHDEEEHRRAAGDAVGCDDDRAVAQQ